MKNVNYLDLAFNLNGETYKSYTKPKKKIKSMHKDTNHAPSVIGQTPVSIEPRLSTLCLNKKIFQEALPPHLKSLKNSSYRHTLTINVLKMKTTPPT